MVKFDLSDVELDNLTELSLTLHYAKNVISESGLRFQDICEINDSLRDAIDYLESEAEIE